jgi:putative ABC transport system substrate-binding protein
MKRRDFMVGLGAAAALAPNIVQAQEPGRTYRLGTLFGSQRSAAYVAAFFDELRVLGFVEGQNLAIDGGDGIQGPLPPEHLATLRKLRPDAIFSAADPWARVLQDAMPGVPIICLSTDLMASGMLKSLARPDSSVTGVSFFGPELDGKRQQILLEAVPSARRIAILGDGNVTALAQVKALQESARAGGVEPLVFYMRSTGDIAPVMDQIKASGAASINVMASILASSNRKILIERATALKLPAIYEWPEMAEEGGLLGYGARLTGIFRQTARMVGKVFRGVKPVEIPVEQQTQFDLVVNLRAAKAIDIEIPAGLVLRADKLIE